MDIESYLMGIKKYLWIPFEDDTLKMILEKKSLPNVDKIKILERIEYFIQLFDLFKNNQAFMKGIYFCIKKALNINFESIEDIDELLIKTTLMYLIQQYINYAHLSQKEQILNFLASSLEKLDMQPLFLNLGLLVKPMYADEGYIQKLENLEEVEVEYILNEELELHVKQEIDKWLDSQIIDLTNQDDIIEDLENIFNELINACSIEKESQKCKDLYCEVMEMYALKLTLLSLEDPFQEDSLKPIPIK